DFGCDLVEMELHGFAVASRQHEGGAGSTFGTDRTKQISRLGRKPGDYLYWLNQVVRRFVLLVSSARDCKYGPVSSSSVQRHAQLPSVRPGTFIRASAPRLSRSCSGAMARAAIEDHANCIRLQATSRLYVGGGFKYRHTFCRWSSGSSSYHARVAALSCVP